MPENTKGCRGVSTPDGLIDSGPHKTGKLPDTVSGSTENKKNLIENTWRAFCSNNREYGVLLFLSLFVRHPEYLPMFSNFRAKHPAFREHRCVIVYHLMFMVDNILEQAAFEVLIRGNATEPLRRQGVRQRHYKVIVIDVLQAKEKRLMTPAAVDAWEKFLSYMVTIIADVFDKAASKLDQKKTKYSSAHAPTNTMHNSALPVSSQATEKGREATTSRAQANKLDSKSAHNVISPFVKFASLGFHGAPEDLAATCSAKSSSKKRRLQPDLHTSDVGQGGGVQGTTTVTSLQADKTRTTEKSKWNKGLRDSYRVIPRRHTARAEVLCDRFAASLSRKGPSCEPVPAEANLRACSSPDLAASLFQLRLRERATLNSRLGRVG
ncbi:hypothetical protein MRX96_043593 [Rhipicephalus microplus]